MSQQYEFVGTVKAIPPTQTFASGFTKREIVVTSEDERYPQDIAFEFLKDKIALLDEIQEADRVKVAFDLRGREYNGRYFVSVSGWKIEKMDAATPPPAGDEIPPMEPGSAAADELVDDMPF